MGFVCTYKDFDVDKVKVLKPYWINDNTMVFDIKYNNEAFLIQTPIATIPYSYSLFDNKVFRIDILCQGCEIHDMLQSLSRLVMKKVNRFIIKSQTPETSRKFKPLAGVKIIQSHSCPMSKLTLANKNVDHIGVFDMTRQAISIEHIHTFDRIICLFEVRRLVVIGNDAFWQTNLLQIKQCSGNVVYDSSRCMIEDGPVVSWDASKFDVYSKMNRLGIHVDAIKHKMMLDGFGDDFFECWLSRQKQQSGQPVPPPTPPPLPKMPLMPPPPPPPIAGLIKASSSSCSVKQATGPLAFLKDISNGNFALRKTNGKNVVENIKVKVNEFTPPSLEQIQGALSKLKKISIFDK